MELIPGSGYGSGYGDGSGYGYGDGEYLTLLMESVIGGDIAARIKESQALLAFWRSAPDGRPANGGGGAARKVGDIEEIAGPLQVCTARALHGTLKPSDWKGERLWVVALYPPWQEKNGKYGSLKREILAEISPNPWA